MNISWNILQADARAVDAHGGEGILDIDWH